MEEEHHRYSVNGEEPQNQEVEEEDQQLQHRLRPGAEEKLVLQFMDSMHNYLSLFDALSSTLRQGWLDLASARHSMGSSRINSSLLDLKFHSAATTLKITEHDGKICVLYQRMQLKLLDPTCTQPCFALHKWVSSEHESTQLEDENMQIQESGSVKSSETAEMIIGKNLSELADNDEVQKERSKPLSVFGILISPKLRATQLSFERALETLLEIANMRSSLLYSFHQLQEVEDTKE